LLRVSANHVAMFRVVNKKDVYIKYTSFLIYPSFVLYSPEDGHMIGRNV